MESIQKIESKLKEDKWRIITDRRPSHYYYALMSKQAYKGSKLKEGDVLSDVKGKPLDAEWTIQKTFEGKQAYFGVIFVNETDKQIVVAHRGSNTLTSIIEDLHGIYLNKLSKQKSEAYKLIEEAVELAKTKGATLSFTGHSLGAFLAELSVFYCYNTLDFPNVSAVTFESPGSKGSLEKLQSNLDAEKIELTSLDIIGYVSYPNLINTCNHHIGTLYHVQPQLGDLGWVPVWHLKQVHSLTGFIDAFNGKDRPNLQYVQDWPVGNQYTKFFESTEFSQGKYEISKEVIIQSEKVFQLHYAAHYTLNNNLSGESILALKHFSPELQGVLVGFFEWKKNQQNALIEEKLKALKIHPTTREHLLSYSLTKRSNGRLFVTIPKGDIFLFQYELSWWLENYGTKLQKLMGKAQQPSEGMEIIAQILAPGSVVSKGAILKNAKAIGMKVAIPENTSEKDIIHLKEIIKQVQTSSAKVTAQIVAPRAKVDGKLENVTAEGILFEITQDREDSEKPPLIFKGPKKTKRFIEDNGDTKQGISNIVKKK